VAALWLLVLLIIYWFPFSFSLSREHFFNDFDAFFSVPFSSYYFTSEYRALTQLLQKILFVLPLGAGAACVHHFYRLGQGARTMSWGCLMVVLLLLELGQLFIVQKYGDVTDLLLAWLGLYCGAKLWQVLGGAFAGHRLLDTPQRISDIAVVPKKEAELSYRQPRSTRSVGQVATSSLYRLGKANAPAALGLALCLSIALYLLLSLSVVPYNIKELILGDYKLVRAFGMVMVLFWLFGFGLNRLITELNSIDKTKHISPDSLTLPQNVWRFSVLHAVVSGLLVLVVFPQESIYDIVGAPVWGWLPQLELLLRLAVLFWLFCVLLQASAAIVLAQISSSRIRVLKLLLILCCAIMLAYLVVIKFAATDNLTELLRDNGHSWAVLLVILYLGLLFYSATALAMLGQLSMISRLGHISLVIVAAPLGYWLLSLGLESLVVKYDKVFSALQFLLSRDRAHYAQGSDLLIRFTLGHYVITLVIALAQYSLWLNWLARAEQRFKFGKNNQPA